jgi:hypothetical protein
MLIKNKLVQHSTTTTRLLTSVGLGTTITSVVIVSTLNPSIIPILGVNYYPIR